MSKIIVTYPPKFDGELHIEAKREPDNRSVGFSFAHARNEGQSDWDVLVVAAKAILAQEERVLFASSKRR